MKQIHTGELAHPQNRWFSTKIAAAQWGLRQAQSPALNNKPIIVSNV